MKAIKQIMRIPHNHEIKLKIPSFIPENELVEMILIVKNSPDNFKQKNKELKEAMKDKLFVNDLEDVSKDFMTVDLEKWE